jgi:acetyl-CoA acetyltransferase
MQASNGDDALIAAAVEVPYRRKREGVTTAELLGAAFSAALAQSGLRSRDVDGLGVASFTLMPDHAIDMAWRLGLRTRWNMDDCNGGASGINLLQHAIRAIQCGDANVIVLLSGDTFSPADFKRLVEHYNVVTREYLRPLPNGGPNSLFAMLTQRHARAHALTREDYGRVCIAQREWAMRNPDAVYRTRLTMEDYLAAPLVADPLCRFDCVPVVSGANAIVVARADRIKAGPAVKVTALQSRFNDDHQNGDGLQTALAALSDDLWRQAQATPGDMDLVSVYDDYPAMALIQLADLGFAADGDVRALISRVVSHALPVNTSGGQLSVGQAGAAGGMHGLVEAVGQLQGISGIRQIPDARSAVVSGYGMVGYRYAMCSNAVVLAREDGERR